MLRVFVSLQRCGINSPVKGCVVGTYVVSKHTIKLCQRGDGVDVQSVEPSFLHGTKMALYFAFASTITDFCVKKQNTQ